jgi:hypothetical protein
MGLADRSPDRGVEADSAGCWRMEATARSRPVFGGGWAVLVGLGVSSLDHDETT